jgi:hypothetical protein
MINTLNLERDMTDFFADKLNLTTDATIFRGAIPESVDFACAVRLTGIVPGDHNDNPTYNVQVFGKYRTRDEALNLIEKCANCVPIYGALTEHFKILFILPESDYTAPVVIDDKGVSVQFASVNLRVSVLTRQA